MGCVFGRPISSSGSEYEAQCLLGSGAFGAVVKCLKKSNREMVALKIINETVSIQQAKEEGQILNNLKALGSERFNIVKWNESFIFSGYYFMDFELLDISLSQFLQREEFLPLNHIRPIIHQLAVALNFLEVIGVVHADIKPENIMLVDSVGQPLRVKLIDFGWALCNPEDFTGVVMQTLPYRSPEVLLGAPVSCSIDTWSLGCTAAEMLTGTPLFPGSDEYEMILHILLTLGLPPDRLLEIGLNTGEYFHFRETMPGQHVWTLKSAGKLTAPESLVEIPLHPVQNLGDILKVPDELSAEDAQSAECDRACFIDLVERMLCMDDKRRISPAQILVHPFIRLSHFGQSCNDYVMSAFEHLVAASYYRTDGADNDGQPSISPASPISPISNTRADQEVIRGAKRSSPKRPLDDLDHSQCALRSTNQQDTTCDFNLPPKKRWKFSSSTESCQVSTTRKTPSASTSCGRKRRRDDEDPQAQPSSSKKRRP